ncbi:MAG: hypothetical protein WD928_01615 [Gammaproteobacteria bacterium]
MSHPLRMRRAEMGISRTDFVRVFPNIVGDGDCHWQDTAVRVSWPAGKTVAITLSPERVRRIASLSIPSLDVEFEFTGMSTTECESFMQRFDRAFHKGGG